ncbi:MAG: hypothetical protein IMY77_00210 [Chloroflexi bacterium]|nr:hypothetical protein [Chloroflexota bacterium]
MLKKKVIVHLDSGATREHEIHTKDEAAYEEKVVDCAKALMKNRGVLQFGTPFCLYKILNVAALEFTDPPQPSEKLPFGFRSKQED